MGTPINAIAQTETPGNANVKSIGFWYPNVDRYEKVMRNVFWNTLVFFAIYANWSLLRRFHKVLKEDNHV